MKLGCMKDGRYFKNVGYLQSGSQPKFYLGRDRAEAMVRAGKLEQIWRFVLSDYERAYKLWTEEEQAEDSGPYWFGFALNLAKVVAEGRPADEAPGGWSSDWHKLESPRLRRLPWPAARYRLLAR